MTNTAAADNVPNNRAARNRSVGVIAAAVCAMIAWLAIDPIGGHHLSVGAPGHTTVVTGVSVAIASLVVGLAAWGLRAVLDRKVKHPARIWTIIAIVVLLISIVLGPLGGTHLTDKLDLTALHLVVAAVLFAVYGRSPRRSC